MKQILFCFAILLLSLDASVAQTRAQNTVILDETGVQHLQLELAEAVESDFEETVFALGRIEIVPGNRYVVSSRIPGRALQVHARPDHAVKAGETLVVVESRLGGNPPPEVRLAAPADGLVSEVHVAPGEPVSPDHGLVDVVDLRTVYGVARVPEHLAGGLEPGQQARIRVPAYPEQAFTAAIEHIGVLADAASGTVEAAFYIPNPDLLLRPGMRAEFHLMVSSRAGVTAVPREAVLGDESGRFVFVADYGLKNAFVRTPVTLGARNDLLVEITGGLLPGDEVVTRGAYALQHSGRGGVSLKEALDAAHGHPHAEDGSELSPEELERLQGGHGHDHAHGHGWTGLTRFFAATSGVLFLLLILLSFMKNRAPREEPSC